MCITDAPARTPRQSSRRRAVARTIAATLTAATLVVAGSQSASAATTYVLYYHQVGIFPSQFWGETKVCVHNVETEPGEYAKVRVTPVSRPDRFDDVYADPGATTCIRRWWWAAPIVANNISPSYATVEVTTS